MSILFLEAVSRTDVAFFSFSYLEQSITSKIRRGTFEGCSDRVGVSEKRLTLIVLLREVQLGLTFEWHLADTIVSMYRNTAVRGPRDINCVYETPLKQESLWYIGLYCKTKG